MKYFLRQHPHWAAAILAIVVVSGYWLLWAQDRYLSRATVVLESPQIAKPELSFSSLLTGSGGSKDLLLLREHLLSVDMLKRVQEELDFRRHYSRHGDLIARLGDPQAPIEDLHEYYLGMVTIEMDEYAGVLNIRAQAYTAEFAHKLARLLLEAGEAHMNEMGRRLAQEQVRFLEGQVDRLRKRLDGARADLLAYQNEHGLISPTQTVESINQVVATLEGRLASLKARRRAVASYQSPESAEMKRLEREIAAVREQIANERDRLARAAGDSLNHVSAEYRMLELQAEFARESYASALEALESTRLEAARKLKQVSVLQSPLYPEYPTKPDRIYNASVFTIITLFLALIASMLLMIIRDHRD